MPTKSSWSSSSTSICHRSRPHASPHRESARTPQPPQCSGDLGNPALDLTHFFLRVEKVGLRQHEGPERRYSQIDNRFHGLATVGSFHPNWLTATTASVRLLTFNALRMAVT